MREVARGFWNIENDFVPDTVLFQSVEELIREKYASNSYNQKR